jgi:hypothetical protein
MTEENNLCVAYPVQYRCHIFSYMILNMFHIALITMHAVVDKHLAMQIGSVRPSAPGRSGSGQLNSHKAARPDGSDPLPAAASIRSVHLLVGQLYVRPAFSGKGTRGKAEGSRAEERWRGGSSSFSFRRKWNIKQGTIS